MLNHPEDEAPNPPLGPGQEVLVPLPLQVWDLGRVLEDDGAGHLKVLVGEETRWMATDEVVPVMRPRDVDRGDRVYAITPRGWEGRWVGRTGRFGARLKNPDPRFQGPLFDRRTPIDELRQPLVSADRDERNVGETLVGKVRSDPLGFLISMLPLVMLLSVIAVVVAIALRFLWAAAD